MVAIAVIIGATIASERVFTTDVFLALFAAFLICGAGNTINDYFDFEIDRINNPKRPIPAGKISLRAAYIYALSLFVVGVVLSFFIRYKLAFAIALFNSALLYVYAWNVKKRGGVEKNIAVSYLVASPFLFGGIAVGNPAVTLFLVLCAAFANVGREVIKDIEDYEGDKRFANTLPIKIGFRASAKIAGLFILLAILISPLPYLLNLLSFYYLVVVALADIIFIYVIADFLLNITPEKAGKTQKLIKAAMIIALLAFFIGSI
jgi:geranylgeranylglycerol-phosphate geranylgeranyltransferase